MRSYHCPCRGIALRNGEAAVTCILLLVVRIKHKFASCNSSCHNPGHLQFVSCAHAAAAGLPIPIAAYYPSFQVSYLGPQLRLGTGTYRADVPQPEQALPSRTLRNRTSAIGSLAMQLTIPGLHSERPCCLERQQYPVALSPSLLATPSLGHALPPSQANRGILL